jgi:catechol 2,3-dioxygenase-like lactoylglutathione lyase family enzyme
VSGASSVTELGMIVPDLDEAAALLALFGYREVERGGPALGADGRVLMTMRLRLPAGPDLVIEQLDDARGEPVLPRWGLDSHPCWYVDDIEAAVAGVREAGMAAGNTILDRFAAEAGPESTYIHFDSPWGMDLELISNPQPVAYEREGAATVCWHPARPATWAAAGPPPAPAPQAAVPTNRGTAHIGIRVPDFDQALDFFTGQLGCELVFKLPRMMRSGGVWVEIPDQGEAPEPDRSVPDQRLPHGTQIRVGFVRCADFNFEPMELLIPDGEGVLRPAFDREAAKVLHPTFRRDSLPAAGANLAAAGVVEDPTLPGIDRLLTPWGQAFALAD